MTRQELDKLAKVLFAEMAEIDAILTALNVKYMSRGDERTAANEAAMERRCSADELDESNQ